jgi:hypothetical protein
MIGMWHLTINGGEEEYYGTDNGRVWWGNVEEKGRRQASPAVGTKRACHVMRADPFEADKRSLGRPQTAVMTVRGKRVPEYFVFCALSPRIKFSMS